ncbi:MAG: hypothetical protein HY738_02940 [Bacteroidia bacterium]|nr:hypothetical protein [Bacteroidia bacterium]
MKSVLFPLLFLFLGFTLLNACKPEEEETPASDPRAILEGQWLVDETETPVTKHIKDFYDVYIQKSSQDSTKILIGNFYNLGIDYDAIAVLNGSVLHVDPQVIAQGYQIEGTGTISDNSKSINWNYTVDPGDQMVQVTALYTKQ